MEKKYKILLVEDNKGIRDSMRVFLDRKDTPINLEYASTKEQGIEKIESNQYDVIITDGVLREKYSGEKVKDLIKEGGLEIAMKAKEKSIPTIGFSTQPDKLNEIAKDYLDYNLDKTQQLLELRQTIYEIVGYEN